MQLQSNESVHNFPIPSSTMSTRRSKLSALIKDPSQALAPLRPALSVRRNDEMPRDIPVALTEVVATEKGALWAGRRWKSKDDEGESV